MNCDEVLLTKMAEADGESVHPAIEAANKHVDSCENCRREIAQMREMNEIFDHHRRFETDARLWPVVQGRIGEPAGNGGWITFAALALALVAFKTAGMLFDNAGAWLLGLVPLVLAGLLFLLLRENPFKVNTEIILESHHG